MSCDHEWIRHHKLVDTRKTLYNIVRFGHNKGAREEVNTMMASFHNWRATTVTMEMLWSFSLQCGKATQMDEFIRLLSHLRPTCLILQANIKPMNNVANRSTPTTS